MRVGKYCTVGGEMKRYGEQEVSWKTIKGRDGEAGSKMERKGHVQLDTTMC